MSLLEESSHGFPGLFGFASRDLRTYGWPLRKKPGPCRGYSACSTVSPRSCARAAWGTGASCPANNAKSPAPKLAANPMGQAHAATKGFVKDVGTMSHAGVSSTRHAVGPACGPIGPMQTAPSLCGPLIRWHLSPPDMSGSVACQVATRLSRMCSGTPPGVAVHDTRCTGTVVRSRTDRATLPKPTVRISLPSLPCPRPVITIRSACSSSAVRSISRTASP